MCCSTWIKKALNSGAESSKHGVIYSPKKKRSCMRLRKFTRSNLLISLVTTFGWEFIRSLTFPSMLFQAFPYCSMSLHAHTCSNMSIPRPSMFIHIHWLPIYAHPPPSIPIHAHAPPLSIIVYGIFREESLYLCTTIWRKDLHTSMFLHSTVLREMVVGMPRWKCCTLVVSSGSTRRQCSHVELLKWGSYALDIVSGFD